MGIVVQVLYRQAMEMGFTYLLGPIKILFRPRIIDD